MNRTERVKQTGASAYGLVSRLLRAEGYARADARYRVREGSRDANEGMRLPAAAYGRQTVGHIRRSHDLLFASFEWLPKKIAVVRSEKRVMNSRRTGNSILRFLSDIVI